MKLSTRFIVASLPAALIGAGLIGSEMQAPGDAAAVFWQLELLERIGLVPGGAGIINAVALGAAFWLPLLIVSIVVSRIWAEIFARTRARAVDSGWLVAAWLYSLMLPVTMPVGYAALGLSFGLVFGCHLFGGTGRYLVSPALLGVVFLGIAYPPLFETGRWLPGGAVVPLWDALHAGAGASDAAGSTGFLAVLAGPEVGAVGSASALACFVGAAWLIAARAALVPVVAAALIAVTAAGAVTGDVPWYWQFALGSFPFAVAFIATDSSVLPSTAGGRWVFGALIGALTVAIRTADPAHPEGTWQALLLASLCVPLLDRICRGRTDRKRLHRASRAVPESAGENGS